MPAEHTPGAFPENEGDPWKEETQAPYAAHLDDSGLNKKLVQAIEKQAELDDTIERARADLANSQRRIRELESVQEEHKRMLDAGLLIQKKDAEQETKALMNKLVEESRQRTSAVESKKEIEKELEDLTRSLFEEANKLVVVERQENATLHERNEMLATQLKDSEVLLASHQAQLEELKTVMQKMSTQRDDLNDSRPSSPLVASRSRWSRDRDSLGRIIAGTPNMSPKMTSEHDPSLAMQTRQFIPDAENPEQSAGMLMPRYRTDTTAFAEFITLLNLTRRPTKTLSRQNSNADLYKNPDSPKDMLHPPSRTSSPANDPSPHSVTTTGASPAMSSLWNRYANDSKEKEPSLRETKFLKRAIVEDIDPTLRLDLAPELGYLTRRSIQSAVLDGTLIVEPVPSHLSRYAPERIPCALCAESRYVPGKFERSFRLRTNDKPDTQTHMLCSWCTDRVRSVCTYVMFLRQIRDGLWRVEGETEEMRVWEESVKLRECMFWARIGHILET